MSQQSGTLEGGTLILLFVFIGLLIGSILRMISKFTHIPYTPMLLVFGMLFGYFRQSLGHVGNSYEFVKLISPHVILFIFIPILIFQSGFNCQWHIFKRSLINILILAIPGVLIGSALYGVSLKVIMRYDNSQLNWYQAMTIGSILSATDPVAVVALLKQLGASNRFNTLIQGQSLLNDGTAMVFFSVFAQLSKSASTNFGQSFVFFLRVAFGGFLLGIVFGFISGQWIKRIIRDQILIACITVVSCYLCFFAAQFTIFQVSGILSLVVLALFLCAVGKTKIYPQSEHALHVVWSFLQYISQTLIFLVTGLLIIVQSIQIGSITKLDWIRMPFFWLVLHLCRFIMVIIFLPFLRYFGYGLNWKEFLILVYAGLRGTLGLTLALIIAFDKEYPVRFRQLTIFYVGGMAAFTLIINGLTCGPLVKFIKMIQQHPVKIRIYEKCKDKIKIKIQQEISKIEQDRFLSNANWRQVKELLNMKGKIQSNQYFHQQQDSSSINLSDKKFIKYSDIFQELRFRMLVGMKKTIWELYQNGKCRDTAANIISSVMDQNLDDPSTEFQFWQYMKQYFAGFNKFKILELLKPVPLVGKMVRSYITYQIYDAYDCCVNMILIFSIIKQMFRNFPIQKMYLNKIKEQIAEQQIKIQFYICQLQQTYPGAIRTIQTRKAAYSLLYVKKKQLMIFLQEGYIDYRQYQLQRKELDKNLLHVQSLQIPWQQITSQQMALQCPLFTCLNKQQINQIINNSKQKKVKKGQILQQKNQLVQYYYLIQKGTIKQKYQNYPRPRGSGSLVCLTNLVNIQCLSFCDLQVTHDSVVLQIKAQLLRKFFKSNQQFEKRVYIVSLPPIIKINQYNQMSQWTSVKIRNIAQNSELIKLQPKQEITLQFGGFVFYGILKLKYLKQNDQRQELSITNFSQVQPSSQTYYALKYTILLKFTFFQQLKQVRPLQRMQQSNRSRSRTASQIIKLSQINYNVGNL